MVSGLRRRWGPRQVFLATVAVRDGHSDCLKVRCEADRFHALVAESEVLTADS